MDGQKIRKRAKSLREFFIKKTRELRQIMSGSEFSLIFFDSKSTDSAQKFIRSILSCSLSFLLGASPMAFDSYPAGIALLCATSEYPLFILIGTIAAAIVKTREYSLGCVIVLGAVFLIRLCLGKKTGIFQSSKKAKDSSAAVMPFHESFIARTALAALASAAISVLRIIALGLSFYALGAMLFSVVCASVFCFILCGRDESLGVVAIHRDASDVLLCFLCVLALSEYSVFGFSLALSACTFVVLLYSSSSSSSSSSRHDTLRSTICALVCGLSCSASASAMFAIMGFSYAIIHKYYKKLSLAVSLLCTSAFALTFFGAKALTGTLPDVACGALIFIAFDRLKKNALFSPDPHPDKEDSAARSQNKTIRPQSTEKNSANETVTRSLSELSDILTRLSANLRRPTYDDVNAICRDVCSRHCANCRKFAECYSGIGGGNDLVPSLTDAAIKNQCVSRDDFKSLENSLSNISNKEKCACQKCDKIVSDINEQLSALSRSRSEPDCNQAFALCCKNIARLICESDEKRSSENEVDYDLTKKATQILASHRIAFDSVGVYGKREKSVFVTGIDPLFSSAISSKLKNELSEALGCRFSSPVFEKSGSLDTMTLDACRILRCESHSSCLAVKGEEVCGDTTQVFEDNGSFYSVVSDGTGSGSDAAISSRICCSFAEKLTKCGGSLPCVLGAINDFILSQSFECGATADLFCLDLYTCEARFVKSGTPPTYVIRDNNIFKISTESMPIGLTHEMNTDEITMTLREGDTVIMASDGVFYDAGAGISAAQLVIDNQSLSCAELSDLILDRAAKTSSIKDDLSVCVVKVFAA